MRWSRVATGINLWREWARIEIAGGKEPYQLPAVRGDYAGLDLVARPTGRSRTLRRITTLKLPCVSSDAIMPAWFFAPPIRRGFNPCWKTTAAVSLKNFWPSNLQARNRRPEPHALSHLERRDGQIDLESGRIAAGVIATQREQIRSFLLSRINVIAYIRSWVRAFRAVRADGGVDGVDDVLGKK